MRILLTASLVTLALSMSASAAWVNVTGSLANKTAACGNVYCLVTVPGQNKVMIGICGGVGLWNSTDNGTSWAALGSSSGWVDPQAVVFDKDNPNVFWETGIHGGQVHKSTDGGATYTILPGVSGGDGMGVDLTDPQRKTIVVGAHEGAGLHKSTDGGATWSDITAGTSGWTNFPIVINAQTYVEGGGNGAGIYRTTTGGSSWTKVSAVAPNWEPLIASTGAIYWTPAGNQAILRSTDQGATWTSMAKAGDGGATMYTPIEMPDGSIVAIGSSGLVRCTNGTTWTTIVSSLPAASGLTKGNIAYDAVSQSFFMSFWNCNTTIPTNAIWKYDYATSARSRLRKTSTMQPPGKRIVAGRSNVRVRLNGRAYDVHGRLVVGMR